MTGRIIPGNVDKQILRGKDIGYHIDSLGMFRIRIFREYPYLYDGDLQYEQVYLGRYQNHPDSFLILVSDGVDIAGACTGIPLCAEDPDFLSVFNGLDIDRIFYIGEVMLRRDYRGQKFGSMLLSNALGLIDPVKYETVCLCTVDRGLNHPAKPAGYTSPEYLWKKFNFEKHPEKIASFDWKDIGMNAETTKPMNIWFRIHNRNV